MNNKAIRVSTGLSMIIFPLLLLAGFIMHPDILSLRMITSADDYILNFHHQNLFHIGHLIVFASVPFILLSVSGLIMIQAEKGKNWLITGGFMAIAGAVILAGDKGALCIVLSAFDSLSEQEFTQITPALISIMQRKGLLVMFYLLPLLPLGAAAQIIGLIKNHSLKILPGIMTITGLILLNNPDIEIISSLGALLMCTGYIPLGVNFLKGEIK